MCKHVRQPSDIIDDLERLMGPAVIRLKKDPTPEQREAIEKLAAVCKSVTL